MHNSNMATAPDCKPRISLRVCPLQETAPTALHAHPQHPSASYTANTGVSRNLKSSSRTSPTPFYFISRKYGSESEFEHFLN
jgi:hypothetical protein